MAALVGRWRCRRRRRYTARRRCDDVGRRSATRMGRVVRRRSGSAVTTVSCGFQRGWRALAAATSGPPLVTARPCLPPPPSPPLSLHRPPRPAPSPPIAASPCTHRLACAEVAVVGYFNKIVLYCNHDRWVSTRGTAGRAEQDSVAHQHNTQAHPRRSGRRCWHGLPSAVSAPCSAAPWCTRCRGAGPAAILAHGTRRGMWAL